MDLADWLAVYGAALSTLLAVIMISHKLAEYRPFRFRPYSELEFPSANVDGHLTNLSRFQIAVDGVWVGYTYRPWLRPWRREFYEADMMIGLSIPELAEFQVDSKLIEPGGHIFVTWNGKEPFKSRLKLANKAGLDHRISIIIDHSLSRASQILPINSAVR